jgi:hypothetical protein
MAIGEAVADPDWESKKEPDEAVITESNRAGRTMVCPIRLTNGFQSGASCRVAALT